MCDNALLSGFALGRNPVDRKIVLEVCQDFDLRQAGDEKDRRESLQTVRNPA